MAGGTFAFVIGGLIKGFLGGIGGKIFKGLFSSSGDLTGEAFLKLFKDAFAKFAEDLKLHIDTAFYKERFRNAELSVRELVNLFNLYSATGESSKDLLDDCVVKANDSLVALDEIGHPAIQHFAVVSTLMIAIYEERSKVFSKDQLKPISSVIIPTSINGLDRMEGHLRRLALDRVSVKVRTIWNIPGNGEISGYFVTILFDDAVVASRGFPGELGEGMSEYIKEQESKYEEKALSDLSERLQWLPELKDAWLEKYPTAIDATASLAIES